MCRRVECPTCQQPTYAGCGNHVEQVLGDVPPERRCQCPEKPRRTFRWRRGTRQPGDSRV